MDIDYKSILLKYINDSPYSFEYNRDWKSMSIDELVKFLNAKIDIYDCNSDAHSYKVVNINSYEDIYAYSEYAPDWCVIESSDAYLEHTRGGKRFFLLERDDMRKYSCKTFGKEYPYDNYGMSLIAVCIDQKGHINSVTSRWNLGDAEKYDSYLDVENLEKLIHGKVSDFVPIRKIGIKSILHISDTHGKHRELIDLPMADVIVHSGDFTLAGTEDEAYDFMNWFCDLPHPHKIFIAGNHDMCMYGADIIEGLPENVHYLNSSSVTIGGLTFYGMPLFMEDVLDGSLNKRINLIPNDTDVLITHQPACTIKSLPGNKSERLADTDLLARIENLQLMYHLCGHEHDTYGIVRKDGTIYSNAALVDNDYHLAHKPHLFNIEEDMPYHLDRIWTTE